MERDTLIRLARSSGGPHVSIYAPMHVRGADTRENPIRFKNRLREARERLEAMGHDESAIETLLAPAAALVDDNDFWQNQTEGLAVLIADGEEQHTKLPYEPPEETVVGERFHIKPLLPLVTGEASYHLLLADLGGARLYRASRHALERIELPEDTPTSLEEATRFDEHHESLRQHTTSSGGPGGGTPQGAFHGSGDETRDKKTDIRQWFAWLDNGVREALVDEDDLPLLFVGVDYLFPLYRDADKSGRLHDEAVTGASESWRSEEELLEAAWKAIGPLLERPRVEALQRYDEIKGTDNAESEPERIVPAAVEGRVDTLIVGLGAHLWGRYDERNRSITLEAQDGDGVVDLFDLAAAETVANGGTVWAVDADHVPGGGNAVAILRY